MGEKTDTGQRILKAAADRIRHFGYAKTTMAEIAADLRMSAGNLYRFFPSKLDIAEALARAQREEEVRHLAEIVARPDMSAREKLSEALRYSMRGVYRLVREQPRVVEIADIIARERPEFLLDRYRQERTYLTAILEQGVQAGEFAPIADLDFMARVIQDAAIKFRTPRIALTTTIEEFESELSGLIDLLFCGLGHRQTASICETA
jgi:AcrR family transcriptional regulator